MTSAQATAAFNGIIKDYEPSLCRHCYDGGGVCCESQRAHHLQKSRRGGREHAENVEAAGTTGIGSGGAAARATRKRTRHMERVERDVTVEVGGLCSTGLLGRMSNRPPSMWGCLAHRILIPLR